MLQLGCNYSAPLVALLHEGRAPVDWIKLSRWDAFAGEFAVARPLRPALLHVLPHASTPSLDGPSVAAIAEAVRACGSPHIALHLAARLADWPGPPSDRAIVERMVAVAAAWAAALPAPLLVENVPYYGYRDTPRLATDPAVIAEVCARTGAGLLLDLAHARVAAWHRGEDVHAYLAALPLARVREIHVCGPALDPVAGLRDRHLELHAVDYDLLAWTLARTAPAIVTLEYGGTGPRFEWRTDGAALERQLARLRDLIGASHGGGCSARSV